MTRTTQRRSSRPLRADHSWWVVVVGLRLLHGAASTFDQLFKAPTKPRVLRWESRIPDALPVRVKPRLAKYGERPHSLTWVKEHSAIR